MQATREIGRISGTAQGVVAATERTLRHARMATYDAHRNALSRAASRIPSVPMLQQCSTTCTVNSGAAELIAAPTAALLENRPTPYATARLPKTPLNAAMSAPQSMSDFARRQAAGGVPMKGGRKLCAAWHTVSPNVPKKSARPARGFSVRWCLSGCPSARVPALRRLQRAQASAAGSH